LRWFALPIVRRTCDQVWQGDHGNFEAFDLTGTAWSAAQLTGYDAKTVARYVAIREAGRDPLTKTSTPRLIDVFMPKIEELVDRSKGKIQADVAHRKITVMGYRGSERSVWEAAGKKVAQCAVAGGQALVPPGAGVVSGLTGGVGFSARADVAQASVEGAEPGQPPFFPGVAGRSPWETAPRAEKAPGSVNGRRSLSHGAQRRSSA